MVEHRFESLLHRHLNAVFERFVVVVILVVQLVLLVVRVAVAIALFVEIAAAIVPSRLPAEPRPPVRRRGLRSLHPPPVARPEQVRGAPLQEQLVLLRLVPGVDHVDEPVGDLVTLREEAVERLEVDRERVLRPFLVVAKALVPDVVRADSRRRPPERLLHLVHALHRLLGGLAAADELEVPLGRLADGRVQKLEAEDVLPKSPRVVPKEQGGPGVAPRHPRGVEVTQLDGRVDERRLPGIVGVGYPQCVGRARHGHVKVRVLRRRGRGAALDLRGGSGRPGLEEAAGPALEGEGVGPRGRRVAGAVVDLYLRREYERR
mmetsp:Transcript_31470/g.75183  ORF Transcript_31470/g.75183 Transcript_31470/m.75183 type:complete len:319 (-) Transcript_31470:114-1070(-)